MRVSASKLRSDIYRILDRILATGEPVEIERDGQLLEIVPKRPPRKLDRLVERPFLECDPEEIVHLDWSEHWRP